MAHKARVKCAKTAVYYLQRFKNHQVIAFGFIASALTLTLIYQLDLLVRTYSAS